MPGFAWRTKTCSQKLRAHGVDSGRARARSGETEPPGSPSLLNDKVHCRLLKRAGHRASEFTRNLNYRMRMKWVAPGHIDPNTVKTALVSIRQSSSIGRHSRCARI